MLNEYNSLIFELSKEGRTAYDLPHSEIEDYSLEDELPKHLIREEALKLPEISELQLVRHYTQLSNKNFGIESGPYPLGSCTMKYNPKVNEDVANLDGFSNIHPNQDPETAQGALELMYNMQEFLAEILGMDQVTLQPAAGAQGELAGILVIKAYHEANGEGDKRNKILVPDSAHRSEEHTSELQSRGHLVCRLLLEKNKARGDAVHGVCVR